MNNVSLAIIGICLAIVIALVVATARAKKIDEAKPAAQDNANDNSEFRMSNDPITLNPPALPEQLSVRGRQQERMRVRSMSGKCLHCDQRATHSSPRWVLVKPIFEEIYRYMGVVPIDHWKIETHVRNDGDRELCEWHHHAAVARMQDKNVSFEADYAKFVRNHRESRLEYQRYELYEEMQIQTEEMDSRGRKSAKTKKKERIAVVTPIQKSSNGA